MDQIKAPFSLDRMAAMYLEPSKKVTEDRTGTEDSFAEILNAKRSESEGVAFSKHANERLVSRNIRLTDGQMERLNRGVEQARDKNINESLVMMDNIAFIVNIKNNTVVTALSEEQQDNHVFTNIDGAVIV